MTLEKKIQTLKEKDQIEITLKKENTKKDGLQHG